ncbi:hypothetical protein K440DRAFT_640009 [Wilcoxina mikolae CBS 423.85]|nr:hypothetical protein K440DRAFT_640009 [Wilcoxina mikolae CBS 423.85]
MDHASGHRSGVFPHVSDKVALILPCLLFAISTLTAIVKVKVDFKRFKNSPSRMNLLNLFLFFAGWAYSVLSLACVIWRVLRVKAGDVKAVVSMVEVQGILSTFVLYSIEGAFTARCYELAPHFKPTRVHVKFLSIIVLSGFAYGGNLAFFLGVCDTQWGVPGAPLCTPYTDAYYLGYNSFIHIGSVFALWGILSSIKRDFTTQKLDKRQQVTVASIIILGFMAGFSTMVRNFLIYYQLMIRGNGVNLSFNQDILNAADIIAGFTRFFLIFTGFVGAGASDYVAACMNLLMELNQRLMVNHQRRRMGEFVDTELQRLGVSRPATPPPYRPNRFSFLPPNTSYYNAQCSASTPADVRYIERTRRREQRDGRTLRSGVGIIVTTEFEAVSERREVVEARDRDREEADREGN